MAPYKQISLNNNLSGVTLRQVLITKKKIPLGITGIIVFIYLTCPTIRIFPDSIGDTFNRPLYELLDFVVIGTWAFLRFFRPRYISNEAKKNEFVFWLVPFSIFLSSLFFIIQGGEITAKPLYEFLFHLRPLSVFQLVVAICGYYKVSDLILAKLIRVLIFVICVSVIYVSLLGLFQYIGFGPAENFLYSFYRYDTFKSDVAFSAFRDYGRITSIFHWANSLGMFLSIALIVIFTIALERGKRFIYFVTLGLGLLVLIIGGSRAAFLTFIFGTFLLIFIRRNSVQTIFFLVLCTAVIIQTLSLFESQTGVQSRILEIVDFVTSKADMPNNLRVRLDNLSLVLQEFNSDSLLTVIGRSANYDYRPQTLKGSFDNEYLKFFVLNGVIGLAAFIYFQFSVITYTWRQYRTANTTTRFLSSALFAVFLSMSISALSQDVWYHYKILQMVYLFFGLLVYAHRNRNSAENLIAKV